MNSVSLQEKYAPFGVCFGCGPSNKLGLQLRSYADQQTNLVTAKFQPQNQHQAFPGVLNGGIIGTLLDCHSNWTAAYHLMQQKKIHIPPCTVTADYHIKLKRPTPAPEQTISLRANVVHSESNKAIVKASLWANEKLCATCEGTFVAVGPNHPAYYEPHLPPNKLG